MNYKGEEMDNLKQVNTTLMEIRIELQKLNKKFDVLTSLLDGGKK